jgi:acetyl esterase/lipase
MSGRNGMNGMSRVSGMRIVIGIVLGLGIAIGSASTAAPAFAQMSERAAWASTLRYRMAPNLTYHTATNIDLKLDLYLPMDASESRPAPTLIYIHGGGWWSGNKEQAVITLLPWIEMGWAVANVEYRLGGAAGAPAAVEDCRCALRWVRQHAKEYRLDPARIVLSGHSAGGHLALMTGLLTTSAGMDRSCIDRAEGGRGEPSSADIPVAAIINWFGITDVADLLSGPNAKTYAVRWLGSVDNRDALASRLSPLTYVRANQPPVFTIHGDDDPTVPYTHGTRLRDALTRAGVSNEMITVPGGKHGGFPPAESLRIWTAIRAFLQKHQLPTWPETAAAATSRP